MQPALFEPERILRSGPAVVRYRKSSSILNKGVGSLSGVDFALNPCVGCQFGCRYCYAAFFQADEVRIANWGTWVDVKENALELVMRARNLGGKRILIGSATDPYQPIEAKLGLTRSILAYLATVRPAPRVYVITRSPIAVRDIDLMKSLPELQISMSITTDDDEIRKAFEPGCASIERRIEALGQLASAGIWTNASLAPLLPLRDPAGFVRRLHGIGVRSMWTGAFHEGTGLFRAGTGETARRIAKNLAWTPEATEKTLRTVRQEIARLGLGNAA